MNESNEVPTYKAPAGVHGPTLGRDLPDGCERCLAHADPRETDYWYWAAWHDGVRMADLLYWWRFPPLAPTVHLSHRPGELHPVAHLDVQVDGDQGGTGTRWFPPAALTRVVDQ